MSYPRRDRSGLEENKNKKSLGEDNLVSDEIILTSARLSMVKPFE